MNRIEKIYTDADFSKLSSIRMKVALLANSGSDLVLEISQIAQVTREAFELDISKH